MIRITSRAAVALAASAALVASLTGCQSILDHVGAPASTSSAAVQTHVVRVVDGDTIVVETVPGQIEATKDKGTETTVRMLGIDAAEMHHEADGSTHPDCGAQAATDHLSQLLPAGTAVTLQFDPRSDRVDRYGRSLAYVAGPSGTDANLSQVAGGYAEAWYPKGEPEPERVPDYLSAAETAKAQHLGPQGSCSSIGR